MKIVPAKLNQDLKSFFSPVILSVVNFIIMQNKINNIRLAQLVILLRVIKKLMNPRATATIR